MSGQHTISLGKQKNPLWTMGFISLLSLILGGCFFGGEVDYRNIRPEYDIRNSPIPVPRPVAKPAIPARASVLNSVSITVNRGDTLYGIAQRYDVEVSDLVQANNLRAPYLIRPGDQLALPEGGTYTVVRGDTLYGISRAFGVDMTSLVRVNGLRAPYTLRVGQQLRLPQGASVRTADATPQRPVAENVSENRPPARAPVNRPAPARDGAFIWPVEGPIVSSFGPKDGGIHNDGVNIAVSRGTEIRAANNGVVVYAGDELRGFGLLLLVRHDDGWVTAYAHNDELIVNRGDEVRKGQAIARAGDTGGVDRPQLHFEMRRGRQAVDPVRYLPARSS